MSDQDLFAKWEEIKETIRIEHYLTDIAYKTWIMPLRLYKVLENCAIVIIPFNQSESLNYIEKRFYLPFKVAVSEAMQQEYEIEFILEKDAASINSISDTSLSVNEKYERANLNPKYTFDTFVVGASNRFTQSAALAVAENPGELYNPLFIYGGVGLGKTHLMHSIGHYIIDHNLEANVLYVTSEQFTNEVIESIRNGNNSTAAMKRFRDKYRNIDVLLIDDIQFIIGKESTQEEFFHTFNQLREQKKAIIISSDKPPKDMEVLEERYKSRFEWGLITDIQSPDYETRVAILLKKQELEGYHIDDDIIMYIAENVKSNIRELEGALNKLIAFSNLEKKQITIDLAKEALKDLISPSKSAAITPEYIIDIVCDHFNISKDDIMSSKRNSEIVTPRHIIMYLLREYLHKTYPEISRILNRKDHTTAISACNKIESEINIDEALNNTINTIIMKLQSN